MDSGYLPEELLSDILKRLPVKTLCRFLSVSKSWNSLILSPFFADTRQRFISATNADDEPTTHLRQHDNRIRIFHRQNKTTIQTINLPAMSSLPWFTVLEVIHGVVSFAYSDLTLLTPTGTPRFIVFWNPAIRRHVSSPLPPEDFKEDRRHLLGAGFDASKKDFKAVWVPRFKYGKGKCAVASRYYKVFSVSSGAWSKSKWTLNLGHHYISGFYNGWFFNGAIYWITGTKERGMYRRHGLVYFDCVSEEFGRMELPEGVRDFHGTPRVFDYKGLLTVLTQESRMNALDMSTQYGLWTMKEYDVWNKDLIVTYGCGEFDSKDKALDVLGKSSYVYQESMLLFDIGKPDNQLSGGFVEIECGELRLI